jgi:hypothetical protein
MLCLPFRGGGGLSGRSIDEMMVTFTINRRLFMERHLSLTPLTPHSLNSFTPLKKLLSLL